MEERQYYAFSLSCFVDPFHQHQHDDNCVLSTKKYTNDELEKLLSKNIVIDLTPYGIKHKAKFPIIGGTCISMGKTRKEAKANFKQFLADMRSPETEKAIESIWDWFQSGARLEDLKNVKPIVIHKAAPAATGHGPKAK